MREDVRPFRVPGGGATIAAAVDTKVEDVMTRPAVVVRAEATFRELANLLRLHRISGLPVVDGSGRLIGVVSESDLLRRLVRTEMLRVFDAETGCPVAAPPSRATAETAARLMSRPAVSIAPEASVDVTLELMRRRGLRRLPVVDSEDHVVGVVSRTDLLQPYTRTDRELRDQLLTEVLPRLGVGGDSVRLTVEAGNVLIGGTVDCAEVTKIEEAVRDTPGVVFVESRLHDRLPHNGGGTHGTR